MNAFFVHKIEIDIHSHTTNDDNDNDDDTKNKTRANKIWEWTESRIFSDVVCFRRSASWDGENERFRWKYGYNAIQCMNICNVTNKKRKEQRSIRKFQRLVCTRALMLERNATDGRLRSKLQLKLLEKARTSKCRSLSSGIYHSKWLVRLCVLALSIFMPMRSCYKNIVCHLAGDRTNEFQMILSVMCRRADHMRHKKKRMKKNEQTHTHNDIR